MSFHASTEEGSITLEGGHILKARLLNVDGEACDAQIDLNSCLSNDDGKKNFLKLNFNATYLCRFTTLHRDIGDQGSLLTCPHYRHTQLGRRGILRLG